MNNCINRILSYKGITPEGKTVFGHIENVNYNMWLTFSTINGEKVFTKSIGEWSYHHDKKGSAIYEKDFVTILLADDETEIEYVTVYSKRKARWEFVPLHPRYTTVIPFYEADFARVEKVNYDNEWRQYTITVEEHFKNDKI